VPASSHAPSSEPCKEQQKKKKKKIVMFVRPRPGIKDVELVWI
jgi:hypothetical protein